jgi:hypothetical protein
METEDKDDPEGKEVTKEILIYSIFGGNEGQVTSDAWTGAPNAQNYPPLSTESRWSGAGIAAAFILAGIGKRVNKTKTPSAQ